MKRGEKERERERERERDGIDKQEHKKKKGIVTPMPKSGNVYSNEVQTKEERKQPHYNNIHFR